MTKTKDQSFWKKIRYKFKLSILNEETLAEVFSVRLSRLHVFLYVFAFVFILITLTSVVIINTPIRNYLPGYLDSEIRNEMIQNSIRADSLENVLNMQSKYLDNIQSIFRGDIPDYEVGASLSGDSLANYPDLNLEKSEITEDFIRAYEDEERYNLNRITSPQSMPENLIFYKPVNGLISDNFSASKKHFGIDIVTKPKESVLATMKGMIIFAGFDANVGYVIQIQHPNGFVSIYKHNAVLLKAEGDEVVAGEAIAIVGNSGELSSGAHLHFELWYKGQALDPEEFIAF
ncbi:M23 family metallopeptidase [Bacteroidales bacterium OttesenSCG-928-I14]|nr:M23 family metallopeptidase [Bacteroidales bacterium OttesenSCG-928-I14]